MVKATWLLPQTRYSDTEAGASRIILQASISISCLYALCAFGKAKTAWSANATKCCCLVSLMTMQAQQMLFVSEVEGHIRNNVRISGHLLRTMLTAAY